MKFIKNYQALILISVFISFIFVRFWNLTGSCLFFDEVFSIHAAKQSWDKIFWFVAQDLIHPPFFYVLLKIWISIGGESLLWVKLFPLAFSLISICPFYLLCKNLKLNDCAISLAFAFFAVNGCLIKYAQEVRMYSVLLCFGLFSIWLFIRFLNDKKGLVWLIIVNILLVNTHYFGWLVVAAELTAELISVLVLKREKLKQFLMMNGLTAVSFIPWVYQIWQASRINADFQQNLGWAEKPAISTVYHFVNDLFEPFYFQLTNIDRAETATITIPLIIFCLVSTALYFVNWKGETQKESILLLIIFIKTPILIALIASWILPVSVWGTRHLIIVFPVIMIFFGLMLEKIRIRGLKITFISVIFLLFGLALFLQLFIGFKKPVWCAWEELASDLEQNPKTEKAKIYVFEDLIAYHIWSALKEKQNVEIIVVKGIEGLLEDKAYFLPRGFDEVKVTTEQGIAGDKFYLAFRDSKFNKLHPPLKNLKAMGYKIGEPKVFVAQGVQTFLVEITK